jgi:hypothetical protein
MCVPATKTKLRMCGSDIQAIKIMLNDADVEQASEF